MKSSFSWPEALINLAKLNEAVNRALEDIGDIKMPPNLVYERSRTISQLQKLKMESDSSFNKAYLEYVGHMPSVVGQPKEGEDA